MDKAKYLLNRLVLYCMARMASNRSFSSRNIKSFLVRDVTFFNFWKELAIGLWCDCSTLPEIDEAQDIGLFSEGLLTCRELRWLRVLMGLIRLVRLSILGSKAIVRF